MSASSVEAIPFVDFFPLFLGIPKVSLILFWAEVFLRISRVISLFLFQAKGYVSFQISFAVLLSFTTERNCSREDSGFFGNISASIGRKTWPHNIGLEDALIAFFALLACVVLLPVLCKGSIRQRLIAISISLLPAWILWRDVGRFVHLLNYVK